MPIIIGPIEYSGDDINRMVDEHPEQVLAALIKRSFGNGVSWDDSTDRTATRILDYWTEFRPPSLVSGVKADLPFNFTTFEATGNQQIICKDIDFVSMCSHHLLPFYGRAHVGYIPNKLMVGLSKIPRLVDFWTQRPCTQEWATDTIAHDLKDRLEAHGVAVVLEARHTCMACRGVMKYAGTMVTSNMRGVFLTSGEARSEFLTLIGRPAV